MSLPVKVIFVSNPTTMLRLCCVVVGVVTIGNIGKSRSKEEIGKTIVKGTIEII